MVTRTNQLGKLMKLKNFKNAEWLSCALSGKDAVALYHPSAVNGKTVQQQADVVATVKRTFADTLRWWQRLPRLPFRPVPMRQWQHQLPQLLVAMFLLAVFLLDQLSKSISKRVKHPIGSWNRFAVVGNATAPNNFQFWDRAEIVPG